MNYLSCDNIYKFLYKNALKIQPIPILLSKASIIRLQSNVLNHVETGFVVTSFVVRLITKLENHNKNICNIFIDLSFNKVICHKIVLTESTMVKTVSVRRLGSIRADMDSTVSYRTRTWVSSIRAY